MEWLDDYKKLLSFPSISSEEDYKKDMLDCFDWIKNQLEGCGFETEKWDTSGHPTLFAKWTEAPGKPTILIYQHYDVQPVDPLELWKTPPFEPTVIDGVMYARGAQDNKGQLFHTLLALKTLYKQNKAYPLNVKLIIEGEEEIGSEHLPEVLKAHAKDLQADHLVIVDVGIPDKDTPAVTLGVRGIVTLDCKVTGSKGDLHSGSHGNLAYNPLFALSQILASAKDETGKITIPHFYDSVIPLTETEKKEISFDFDENKYFRDFGIKPTGGEKGLPPVERNCLRPSLEVNGMWGGYNGKGFKTVIPSEAFAKISCRLVRGQDPLQIGSLVANWLESKSFEGIKVEALIHPGGGPAVLTSPNSKVVKCFSKAYSEIFNKPCKNILEGGSIPIVATLQEASQAEVVLVGLGLATDQIHAPNEHFSLDRIEKGSQIMIRALELLALSN